MDDENTKNDTLNKNINAELNKKKIHKLNLWKGSKIVNLTIKL